MKKKSKRYLPNFSIIVPVFNQWDLIPLLLEGLAEQTVSSDFFELILVDNGSTTLNIPKNLPSYAKVLICEKPGSYAARNTGLKSAQYDWLIFTDADCKPTPQWIASMIDAIGNKDGSKFPAYLVGSVTIQPKNDYPSSLPEAYDVVTGIRQDLYVLEGFGATANICISRALLEKTGPFDENLFSGGDRRFGKKATSLGVPPEYVPKARVIHPARRTWRELSTKQRRLTGATWPRGGIPKKIISFLRALLPPGRALVRIWKRREFDYRIRIAATLVCYALWAVRIFETTRLLFPSAQLERR